MTTPSNLEGKYQLKTIHADIDLLDRRLAHVLKFETFETEAARDAAAKKINQKREPLIQTAKRMAAEGVEYKESELPRSFRPEGVPAPVEVKAEPEAPVADASLAGVENRNARRGLSHAGAAFDWSKSVSEYLQTKKS